MSHTTNRRCFLLSTLAGAASGAAGFVPTAARAIEPISRTEGHHFKLSLAAYSYRNLLQGDSPQLTLVDFIDDCAKFDLDGTELTSYYFPQPPTEAFLRQLKCEAFRRGLDVSGTAVGNDFCFPAGERRSKEIEHVKQWIEYADMMDAPVIRIFSGIRSRANPRRTPIAWPSTRSRNAANTLANTACSSLWKTMGEFLPK